MAVFAIGDPHLGRVVDKPMGIFGPQWQDHAERLFVNWRRTVGPTDIVLVPGDISWAMTLDEALPDLQDLDRLPGIKVLIQGNHDYWWQSISRLRAQPLRTVRFLQNDCLPLDDFAICGTRGWLLPSDRTWDEDPEHHARIYAREQQRLQLSLQSAAQVGLPPAVVLFHYPPVAEDGAPTAFTRSLTAAAGVRYCLYGHLHSPEAHRRAFQGNLEGVDYRLVSCDALDFTPVRIL